MKNTNNNIKLTLDSKIYPVEAIIGAGYMFIDQAYIFLDSQGADKIEVNLKSKSQTTKKQLEELKDAFLNELLYNTERILVAKRNKRIREFIVGRALFSAVDFTDSVTMSSVDDPLGIATPFEEDSPLKKK